MPPGAAELNNEAAIEFVARRTPRHPVAKQVAPINPLDLERLMNSGEKPQIGLGQRNKGDDEIALKVLPALPRLPLAESAFKVDRCRQHDGQARRGTTGMAIADARRRCQGIALVPQQPDLYTRIHHRIVAAVLDVLPIDAVCSIDEFAATVAPRDIPAALTHQIKQRLRDAVGDHITCSIGYAPNRWLAKIAADLDKPDGLTVLHPRDLPGRLLTLDLEDVPGVATRMRTRLARWGLTSVEDLWQADPLQLRAAWGSVTGARLWYALHGYAVAPPRTQRRSIGHGRVLPPGQRQAPAARILARQLVVKAARRMRREGYLAQRLTLSVDCFDAPRWTAAAPVAAANDDRAGLEALAGLWAVLIRARPQATLFRLTVSFDRFRPTDAVQLELPWHAPDGRSRVVRLTAAVDAINSRYGRTLIGYGQCGEPGGYVGAKIAYGRIPELEDFH